jgi:hypothetical protein
MHSGRTRQVAGKFGMTVVTAAISTLVSAAVTAVFAGQKGSSAAPGRPSAPSLTVVELLLLAALLFVVLWLVWFAIWGRRWHGGMRLAGTLAIGLGALLTLPIGLAVR